jgi:hypothetical protein
LITSTFSLLSAQDAWNSAEFNHYRISSCNYSVYHYCDGKVVEVAEVLRAEAEAAEGSSLNSHLLTLSSPLSFVDRHDEQRLGLTDTAEVSSQELCITALGTKYILFWNRDSEDTFASGGTWAKAELLNRTVVIAKIQQENFGEEPQNAEATLLYNLRLLPGLTTA